MPGIEVSKVMINVGSIEELEVGGVNFVREDLVVRKQVLDDPENQPNQFQTENPPITVQCAGCKFWKRYPEATNAHLGECDRLSIKAYSNHASILFNYTESEFKEDGKPVGYPSNVVRTLADFACLLGEPNATD